ncbi:prolyl oligopeptidase family serine peptidase [Microbacterium dauci]|uniref:Prolyl oligopeptidase family serine peptidase n=1 Tax=Microbacterium dauci TaxID=3048008 RepID=A0ABT6ZEN5_9MICO|nr:prolyl oligopeptidase family serine peptidase [Microbacterium sp. LX3-4]MDJ1114627.1 prolyl oligopeptidase family serine peptidase [Microbacterium sp. LX3-4]
MSAAIAPEPHDPFLWLEDIHGADAAAWAAARTAETEAAFAGDRRSALETRLRGILQDPDRLVVPSRHGDLMYDLWRDADNPRGLWRRTTRAAFAAGTPEWETLLDIDALGAAEGTAWAFAGASHGPADSGRALVSLSPDGGDATVVREFDLDALRFVDGAAFTLDAHKHRVAWIDADTLLVATALHGGGVTDSGYPISARRWARGTALGDAAPIVTGVASDVGVFVHVDRTDDVTTPLVVVAHDFFHSELYVCAGSEPLLIDAPQDARVDVHGDLVAVRTTTPWEVAGATHASGTLLVGPLETLTTGDGSDLQVAFAPTATAVLDTWAWTRTRLVLTILDEVRSRLVSLDPATLERIDLPLGLGDTDLFTASVATLDADEDDELWVVARGFLTPPTLLVTDAASAAPRTVRRSREAFDTTGLAATQHWATSADGTRVPYFEVGPAERTGPLPVLMNGYGGFEHALTPEYPAIVGPAWLEHGRVYVVANIRGGGEFGPEWHLAALREHRHRAYEDFVAVSRDLVARGVTTPDRVACHGRSNGGLLVGNMLTQYPDDFGAIVCGVPLLDMRRYTRLSAGASWIAEYGDPDVPADWEFIRTFSPYHLIQPGVEYPASLIYAAASDDRVGPVQARKMAARLAEETDAMVHYLEPIEGGHSGTIDAAATAALHATIHAFLDETVGRGEASPA